MYQNKLRKLNTFISKLPVLLQQLYDGLMQSNFRCSLASQWWQLFLWTIDISRAVVIYISKSLGLQHFSVELFEDAAKQNYPEPLNNWKLVLQLQQKTLCWKLQSIFQQIKWKDQDMSNTKWGTHNTRYNNKSCSEI